MPERDPERLELATELRRQLAPEDTLTPIQARSFVRGLQTAWRVPTIQWGAAESRSQLHDARRLLDAAAIVRRIEGEASANAILCYRRAGELLEWLTRAHDDLETFVPLEFLAAACYQMGGLPAMAAALLGQVRLDSPGKQLYAAFLRADFDGVIRTITAFWRGHLDMADREARGRLLGDDGEDKVSWYFTVELIRTLGAISDTLRRGDGQRLDRALAKLASLDRMALRTLGDDASALVALLNQVALSYREASVYTAVRALGALNHEHTSRLEVFARTQFSRKRGILWTSQRHGIARLLEQSSFALCTPTGSGKTLVANLALVKELLLREEDPAPLALYLVPSRALAGEVEAKLTAELGRDLIVTGLYGGSDWGATDYWLDADQPTVLIATVEKADALMRYLGPLLLRRLRLLIVDEAHQVVPEDDERTRADLAEHSNRSIRLEGFVSRLLPEGGADRARFEETRAACIDYCGENSYELALLDHGIATNHGQMPQRLRRLMTDLIERGICPITVATATLTEGVNLPFDIIFLTALKRRTYDPVKNTPVETPMSAAEFQNLSGRAGRPGASNGMEGITLVAIPTRPSSTAPRQIPLQRRQINVLRDDYDALRRRLLAEELEQAEVASPLALLLHSLANRVRDLFALEDEDFLEWLEAALPSEISDDAGRADTSEESRLADSVDELDGVLLSAIEELQRADAMGLDGPAAEEALVRLWRRTFSAYAAVQEAWLERAFVRRGRALMEDIYPDAEERSRLYQYGFTPYVGRRFEASAPAMRTVIEGAQNYGRAEPGERLAVFVALGQLIADDRGYGFRVRATETDRALLENWQLVLGWWVLAPEAAGPDAGQLRAWQRFVSDNIEFRLGTAVGAVVARAWSDGAGDSMIVPSLDAWRETTGLPWFGFWAAELLRWGTLDPFVAFALSRGLAQTREAAAARRGEFEEWLDAGYDDLDAEDFIDPQLFLAWERSLPQPERAAVLGTRVPAELVGTTGERGRYRVVPVVSEGVINWIDAAGFVLARSREDESPFRGRFHRQDFELHANVRRPFVERSFAG